MNKCNNCGYCLNHCQCERDWECEKCEISEPPEFIRECGTDLDDDDLLDIEDKEIED